MYVPSAEVRDHEARVLEEQQRGSLGRVLGEALTCSLQHKSLQKNPKITAAVFAQKKTKWGGWLVLATSALLSPPPLPVLTLLTAS
jgi:hypothetical protein